jgi:DNA uptake protein ComE-like DNA-binding protein
MKIVRILIALFALAAVLPSQPAPKKAEAKKEAVKSGTPMDINTVDAATLKTLPGIGDAYAARIIQNRPYSRKDEIVTKAGVPQATYDKIKDQIIAKQGAAKK